MNKITALFLFLSFSSCRMGDAKWTTQDGDFKIELLFEHDGCKVYRFRDGLRDVYYSDCRGNTTYSYTTQTGKSTITHHEETINTGK